MLMTSRTIGSVIRRALRHEFLSRNTAGPRIRNEKRVFRVLLRAEISRENRVAIRLGVGVAAPNAPGGFASLFFVDGGAPRVAGIMGRAASDGWCSFAPDAPGPGERPRYELLDVQAHASTRRTSSHPKRSPCWRF
jgi:hypothetical protein